MERQDLDVALIDDLGLGVMGKVQPDVVHVCVDSRLVEPDDEEVHCLEKTH